MLHRIEIERECPLFEDVEVLSPIVVRLDDVELYVSFAVALDMMVLENHN